MRARQLAPAARRRRRLAALMTAFVVGATACNAASEPVPPPQTIGERGTPFGELLVPTLSASVTDGAVGVTVDAPVTVTAESGVLGAVSMTNADGTSVAGRLSPDGLRWTTTEPLGYDEKYTLSAQSLGLAGVTSRSMTFRTHSPENLTMPYVLPNDGDVVGVGQPVAIRFDENVPNRSAAERTITVATSPPVEGAFYWLSNREVRWRPQGYWKPGTTVDVAVDTYGVDLGDGLFGQRNTRVRFVIGDEVIATADDRTKTLTVRRNGEVVKAMPMSMGKNSTPTDNGIYIIGDRLSHMVMDSSTYGVPSNSPNGYRTEVDYATQMSYSGIYVHAAPWSVGSQGYSNVSHGCLNVNTGNARWFYENTKRGDLVEVSNTVGSTLPGVDGLGDWNIPWEQWKAGNATA